MSLTPYYELSTRTGFHPEKIVRLDLHGRDQRFVISEVTRLSDALSSARIAADAPVLHTDIDFVKLVFPTRPFSLYNVMQGVIDSTPWMGTFCAVCNAGMSFSPIVDGKTLDFYGAGFYEGMTVLQDVQTESYWDHLTGDCLYGPLKGAHLTQLAPLEHSTAGQIARVSPAARFIPAPIDAGRAALDDFAEGLRTAESPEWPAPVQAIVPTEDARLPRFEMGLGVWTAHAARFYHVGAVYAHDNMIFDRFDDRGIVVYIDPDTFTPAAFFTEAKSGSWRGATLLLDNGDGIRDGVVYRQGAPVAVPRPAQLLQRWFGFAVTFPGCEVYHQ